MSSLISPCFPTATSCASVEFLNSTQSSIFDGVFVYHRTTFNGRPVFKHQDLPLYLYYFSAANASCQRWVVGSSLGSDFGILYLDDKGTDVNDIGTGATGWRLFIAGSGFVSHPNVSIVCYEATSGRPS